MMKCKLRQYKENELLKIIMLILFSMIIIIMSTSWAYADDTIDAGGNIQSEREDEGLPIIEQEPETVQPTSEEPVDVLVESEEETDVIATSEESVEVLAAPEEEAIILEISEGEAAVLATSEETVAEAENTDQGEADDVEENEPIEGAPSLSLMEVADATEAPLNGWQKENGEWYYYKDNILVKGWILDKDKWYYLNPETGAMQTEWLRYKDNWYYLRPESGAMVSNGWACWNNKWYWLKSSGVMAEGEWLKYKDDWYYLRSESGAMASNGWVNWNNKWYWLKPSGIMAEGEWLKYKDDWYYLRSESGAMVSNGWANWKDKWYWLKSSGVMVENEWLKYKDEWYYLKASGNMAESEWLKWNDKWYWLKQSGIMAKGIAECENGKCYYFENSGAWLNKYRDGVTYQDVQYLVMDGIATEVVTEADKTLFRALQLMNSITSSDQSDVQKLRICFDYVQRAYTEMNPRIPHYRGVDWPVIYANDMFVNGKGNCFSYAAAFAYLAKAIGYDNVYGCNSGGHGWAEIDGLVYDPEWGIHYKDYSYYGLSYNYGGDVNYRGAIAAGAPYMHVKI